MAKKVAKTDTPKQIVYLWGAGATQAEIDYLGAHTVNLLMRDSDERGEGGTRPESCGNCFDGVTRR